MDITWTYHPRLILVPLIVIYLVNKHNVWKKIVKGAAQK